MNPSNTLPRRRFLAQSSLAAAAVAAPKTRLSAAKSTHAKGRYKIVGFSKPFQKLSYDDTADVAAEVGWDGIECPVRPKGQIEPERAPDELPKLAAALKRRGLEVGVMTTRINSVDQPHTEAALRTAAQLGIKRYRMDYWKYDRKRSIPEQLREIRPKLKDLAAMNAEIGIQGCYQNHSGRNYVGAPVWDLHGLIKGIDPRHLAVCFDIGHATVEGGYAWESHAHLLQPHFGAIYVKDFRWAKLAKGWKAAWCPLGEGMVNKAFFTTLKKSSFDGPISQHHEYDHGEGRRMIQLMQKDLKVLRQWLAKA